MANSGWLVLAAMAFNLTRAVGVSVGGRHSKAVTATIRAQLIGVAARIIRSARRTALRLPTNWPWANRFQKLAAAGIGPPTRPDHPSSTERHQDLTEKPDQPATQVMPPTTNLMPPAAPPARRIRMASYATR